MRDPYWVKIGPTEAAQLLEGNGGNRPINQRVVDNYARDMAEGRWRETGSTISVYNDEGKVRILNGQHRLWAVVESESVINFLFVEEESADVFATFDVGYVRTTSQILRMKGFANTNVLGALARYIIHYTRYADLAEPWPRSTVTNAQVVEWVDAQDPLLIQAIMSDYSVAREGVSATNTWYAALCYLIKTQSPNRERWWEFHERYARGDELHHRSPILILREHMRNKKAPSGKQSKTAWDRQANLAIGIRAWNKYIAGEDVQIYRFQRNMLPMPKVR